MKIAGGIKEDGIVVGNIFDKYASANPIVKWIMKGFNDSLSGLVTKSAPKTIHELGCGEGYWVTHWTGQGIETHGSDFSSQVIKLAAKNAVAEGLSPNIFKQCSIYNVNPDHDSADLIICCEVLEHLKRPDEGLLAMQQIVKKYLILSVPNEPVWRILNIIRAKYLSNLGNTPGHIQHWSCSAFIKMVANYFDIIEVKKPFPWTMLLCKPKSKPEMPNLQKD